MFPYDKTFIDGLLTRYFARYGMNGNNPDIAMKIISRLFVLSDNEIIDFDTFNRAVDCITEFIGDY